MDLWEKALAELVDIVEWIDESSDTMVWRFPRYENEIKYGGQLIVRQAQAAVFVNMGQIADVFPPGQYRLSTRNLPILSTLQGWKYGFHSPFKAEVYFVSTRNFTNLKWGTKNPVILQDREFGPVRLRAYGTYVARVSDPAKFINQIAATEGHFTLEEITDQLRNLIVTRFSDTLGERNIPVVSLAASYNDISSFLEERIAPGFQEYGLEITKLLVENISLPTEVEEALDKRSSMGIIGNMDNYLKYQSANAMESAAMNPGGEASAGIGLGMGFAMANQMGKMVAGGQQAQQPQGPPPLPGQKGETLYYVGKNGKKAGPFNLDTMAGYIRKGAITRDTLLWREGLSDWQAAEKLPEFDDILKTIPPPLPK